MAISAIGDISDHVRRSLEYMTYVRGHSRYILASTSFYTVVLLQQYAQRVLATSSQYIHLFTSKYTKNSQRIFNNIITVCVLLSYAYYELVEYYQLVLYYAYSMHRVWHSTSQQQQYSIMHTTTTSRSSTWCIVCICIRILIYHCYSSQYPYYSTITSQYAYYYEGLCICTYEYSYYELVIYIMHTTRVLEYELE